MTWKDRVAEKAKLTSPEGSEFEAFWTGDDRGFSKYLGIFSIPKVIGQAVQDLGASSDKYPFTITFEGPDHDLEAESFYKACKETGRWTVIHPVKGELILQLVDVSEKVAPVENANRTILALNFIEPISDEIIASVTELASEVESQSQELNEKASDQFSSKASIAQASLVKAIETTINNVTAAAELALNPLFSSQSDINSRFKSTLSGIQSTLDAQILDPAVLAAQLQILIELPILSTTNIDARLANYKIFANSLLTIAVDSPTQKGINILLAKELALVSVISSVSLIAVTGQLDTRSQVVNAINLILELFSDITENLDNSQSLYADNEIDLQYFSQSESYNNSVLIISQAITYLLKRSLDLSIEKKIILKSDRTPIVIAIAEYGGLGENDENYDLFLSSNKLKDNDILILPAGREVVIYA